MEERSDRDYIAILREHGLQVTYQRLAIYQALHNVENHPSAEEIYQQVKKRFPMISLGTVYKTLERFYDVGLVQKVSPLTEVARYDSVVEPHHHMVCVKCQSIHDFKGGSPQPPLPMPETNGFHVLRQQVILHGYCPECVPDGKHGTKAPLMKAE